MKCNVVILIQIDYSAFYVLILLLLYGFFAIAYFKFMYSMLHIVTSINL